MTTPNALGENPRIFAATRLNYTQIEEILDSLPWNAVCMPQTAAYARKEAEPMANETITIVDNRTNQTYTLPIYRGTIRAMDLRQIKTGPDDFGLMTYDPAYMNTAACHSAVTFLDGERGILRYRGYPIEQLAENCTFLEVAYLLLYGELPCSRDLECWSEEVMAHTLTHENVKKFMEGFNYDAHPMGILISTVAALSTFYAESRNVHDPKIRRKQIVRLIGKMPTLAAYAYRHRLGLPYVAPDPELSYTKNYMNMLWKRLEPKYAANPVLAHALDVLLYSTPITNRTAAPQPCAPSAAPMPTRIPPPPRPSPLFPARCTAAPTKRCSACWPKSAPRIASPSSSSTSRPASAS